jgi:GTPase SAR1 family protein/ribosomal protein S27AE
MKVSPQKFFEIKVAIIGNVSAGKNLLQAVLSLFIYPLSQFFVALFIPFLSVQEGKSTVLNALLRDKYSEVAMTRTTAGVKYFRIHALNKQVDALKIQELAQEGSNKTQMLSENWTTVPDNPHSALETLKIISSDNEKLRLTNTFHEKTFDIELAEDLIPMRENTKLVLIDIPGINEAGVMNKYKDFVSDKWNTFDCVIIVMDGKQGVNTEDQVSILKLAKANLKKKDVPVIILCNKIDDPEDEEQAGIVKEACAEVEKIFGVSCRLTALETLLQCAANTEFDYGFSKCMSPVFLPVSAIQAYVFQSTSLMSLEKFHKFDKGLMDKLGREQIGRKRWAKLSLKDQIQVLYDEIINDPEQYAEGLKASNFDKFMTVFEQVCGGKNIQTALVTKQIKTLLNNLFASSNAAGQIALSVKAAYEMTRLLSETDGKEKSKEFGEKQLQSAFWGAYQKFEDACFKEIENDAQWYAKIDLLSRPVTDLLEFSQLCRLATWENQMQDVFDRMKRFVRRYFEFLLRRWYENNGDTTLSLSHMDWHVIWGSLLLMSYNKYFCNHFGQEKIFFETFSHDALKAPFRPKCPRCNSSNFSDYNQVNTWYCGQCGEHTDSFSAHKRLRFSYDSNGKIVPESGKGHPAIKVLIADSLEDPSHLAHVVYKLCEFAENIANVSSEQVPNKEN